MTEATLEHNVLFIYTQLGIVHHFMTITVGPACLTYCSRGMTGDRKQSRMCL